MPKPKPITKKRRMEMMEEESKITGDRISGLPEPILQHIFSFLDMKQAVQASVLGRSWRYVWTSLPVLNFDYKVWKKLKTKKRNQDQFMHFVDQVLYLRDDLAIHKFKLRCESFCHSSRIHSWISDAVYYEAEEIDLEIYSREFLVLPDCIFTSNTRVFKFQGSDDFSFDYFVRPPIYMCSSIHLKTLQLASITLPKGDSNGELILNCPILESLSITECDYDKIKILKICAPLLENLDIVNVGSELKICTPILKAFKCIDSHLSRDVSFDISPVSVSAEIDTDTWGRGRKDNAQRMIKLLKGLRNAYALTITEGSLEAFAKFPEMLESLSDHFRVLRYLRVKTCCSFAYREVHVPLVASFLKIFRSVETLVIEVGEHHGQTDMRTSSTGPACLDSCTFDRLKLVEIHCLHGFDTELEFLKFVLGNAVLLEKITITTKLQKKGGELTAFKEKLLTLAGASSSVFILFILNSKT